MKASHKAGMAEVAADVLHNVGNIFNSIKISARFIEERIFNSRAVNLKKVTDLIGEHANDLTTFLIEDQRDRHIPAYLTEAAGFILSEHVDITKKLQTLMKNIDHVEQVIKAQQGYAKIGGVEVLANINEVIEDAIKINYAGIQRHGVDFRLELDELPTFHMDKQRVLQILVNLISNSKYALSGNQDQNKILTIRSYNHGEDRLRIEVIDNGTGIPQENITKIFTHGFTTREEGHGFGLHSSALAAKAMDGSLTAHSDGPGRGATFTLELPLKLAKVTT
jgi:signal transduction histidine kinase